jgi:hypothetical protein
MKKLSIVSQAISEAISAANTMYASTKEAAKAAANQLNKKLPPLEAVDEVVATYRDDFSDNHNVRAIFKDALILYAAANKSVTVTTKKAGGEVTEVLKGKAAVDESKHKMRAAASAMRKELGGGRASGGGRKASNEVTVANVATLPMRPAKLSEFALVDRVLDAIDGEEFQRLLADGLRDKFKRVRSKKLLTAIIDLL